MAFCSSCGAEVSGAAFCPKCGAAQDATAAAVGGSTVAAAPATAGIDENVAGLLCYIFGWITGLIFLLIDKRPFVKFHGAQAIAFNIALIPVWILLWIVELFLAHIPVLGVLGLAIFPIFGLVVFLTWIFLMYKAYSHEKFKLPVIGDMVEKMVGA
jgi:uncharacterized membrane protein